MVKGLKARARGDSSLRYHCWIELLWEMGVDVCVGLELGFPRKKLSFQMMQGTLYTSQR